LLLEVEVVVLLTDRPEAVAVLVVCLLVMQVLLLAFHIL
jgi:hypothetical protein